MPAPQASMMKQLARVKFAGNSLKVPKDWKQPQGDPEGKQYNDAFKPSERAVAPDTSAVPPLFTPASLNKYHVDTQKMLNSKFGKYIDGICTAICSAWSQWQSTASMAGIVVAGPVATGGMIPPMPLGPLIMAANPPMMGSEAKYTAAVVGALNTAWATMVGGITFKGLPIYAAASFATFPSPAVPGIPNPTPVPIAAVITPGTDTGLMAATLKGQMIAQFGDPTASYHKELFDCIADAVDKCYTAWKGTTMMSNILCIGTVPTMMTPVPVPGPVVGTATMAPGGIV